jgi:hypothetical protein
MIMRIIGIDPGFAGGVACIDTVTQELVGVCDTPLLMTRGGKKREYHVVDMAGVIRGYALARETMVWLEQAQAMPKQGVTSTFHTGKGFGVWLGILGALELPYQTVRPADWMRSLFKGLHGEGKERSVLFSSRVFPGINLIPTGCRVPKDGRADAACIAYYGWMRMQGGDMA